MIYVFWERSAEGNPRRIGGVEVSGPNIEWEDTPGSAMVQDILIGQRWDALDGDHFDPSNINHYALLPNLLAGHRLWISEERQGAQAETVGSR